MTVLGLWLGVGLIVWFGGGWLPLLAALALLGAGGALDRRSTRR